MGSNHHIDLNRSASLANLSLHQLGYVTKFMSLQKQKDSNLQVVLPTTNYHILSGHRFICLTYLETCRDDKIRTCARFTHAPHPKCGEVDQLLHIPFCIMFIYNLH